MRRRLRDLWWEIRFQVELRAFRHLKRRIPAPSMVVTRTGLDGDPIPDDWTMQTCPLCGDTDLLPPGWECRRVKQARAEGRLPKDDNASPTRRSAVLSLDRRMV